MVKKKMWLLRDFIGPIKLSPLEVLGILAAIGGAVFLITLLL